MVVGAVACCCVVTGVGASCCVVLDMGMGASCVVVDRGIPVVVGGSLVLMGACFLWEPV